MTQVNLFDFATSELSQDALLCWLVANATREDPAELRDLGRAFVAWLWSAAHRESVSRDEVRVGKPPRRQEKHVDIVFDAEVRGRPVTFLIEDKTETSQHSGQLQRYKALFGGAGRGLVPVYFKTGYHFGIDGDAAQHGYAVIGLEDWVAFLDEHPVRNDIFADYHAFMSQTLRTREANLAALATPQGHERLGRDYVQYELVKRLAGACKETVGNAAIHHGVNVGGSPWTHYRFANFSRVLPGGIDETLFHRVDARKDSDGHRRYYLCTRQYSVVKGRPEAKAEKLARLRKYIEAYQRAAAAAGSGLRFGRPSRDHQGANESEIGILFFDAETNTTSDVLEKFPAVHAAFVREIEGYS